MMRAGFAALPYMVLLDTRLDSGAVRAYATLLKYAWQDGATFAGQAKLAADMGVSERQVRTYLTRLQENGYIRIERRPSRTNRYHILDVPTKLKKARRPHAVSSAALRSLARRGNSEAARKGGRASVAGK